VSGGGHGAGKRRAHEEEHEEHENHERWLVSYADMMTLLMVLFIVMFAISQVDQRKFMALKTGLSAGFGAPVAILSGGDQLLDPGGAVAPDSVNLSGSAKGDTRTANENPQVSPEKVAEVVRATSHAAAANEAANLKRAQEELKQALLDAGLPKSATFRIDERGLVVTIATDQVLFDSGSAALRWKGKLILDALTPTLAKLPNKISVDGHTDSIPIHTDRYPTNWELSTDRATGVLRYLATSIPVARMSATGFADTRPLRAGAGAAAMSANRRVEIVVLASVDNTAGRAVAEVANQVAQESTTHSSTPGTVATAKPPAKAAAKASTKASAKRTAAAKTMTKAAAKARATTTSSGH
jgi:chemotaxis protein MotB